MINQHTAIDRPSKSSAEIIRLLVVDLGSRNEVTREKARDQLIRIGKKSTPVLLTGLTRTEDNVRWEVAKIFCKISDRRAAPLLIAALEDTNSDVRWLAAEALIAQGSGAIRLLLKALIGKPASLLLRQGVHHVLHDLARKGLLPKAVAGVLPALEKLDAQSFSPVAAEYALESMGKPRSSVALKRTKRRIS